MKSKIITTNPKNIYNQAQRLADVTKKLIMSGNIKRAKTCILKAENLFNTGTADIKNAISNVYLFSISSFMELHHCNIKNLLPMSLQNEYYKQVNASSL